MLSISNTYVIKVTKEDKSSSQTLGFSSNIEIKGGGGRFVEASGYGKWTTVIVQGKQALAKSGQEYDDDLIQRRTMYEKTI